MPRAVVLGCSHALGAEMDLEPGLEWGSGRDRWQYGAQHSYPVLIAQALGYTPENHAVSGGSNDAMFRIFESLFGYDWRRDSYSPTLTSQDIVIACWTGMNRTEIWHESERHWLAMSPGTGRYCQRVTDPYILEGLSIPSVVQDESLYLDYQAAWVNFAADDQSGRSNKIKNILALNALAAAHDIRVVNINSFAPAVNFKFPALVKWPVTVDFITWAEQRQEPSTALRHYFRPTHQAFADHVIAGCVESILI